MWVSCGSRELYKTKSFPVRRFDLNMLNAPMACAIVYVYSVCVYADVSYRWQHRLTFHVYIISLILLNLFYGVALFCIKSNFEFRCSSALLTPLANLNAVNLMLLSQLFMYIVCYGATRIKCRDDFKHNCNMCFSCCK